MTEQRLDIHGTHPDATRAVLAMESFVRQSGLDARLAELVKIRASQINGCAFCLDMHHRDARAHGEDQRRLDVVSAWREASQLFTDAERAALALAEAVTLIGEAGVPDDVWEQVTDEFSEADVVNLLMAIATINVWNRLAIATRQRLPDRDADA